MVHIGVLQEDEGADSDDICAILNSYLTNETKQDICELLSFSSIPNWVKKLAGIPVGFTFMNSLIYVFSL